MNVYIKVTLTIVFSLFLIHLSSAQEICNNAIDDDNDGLIDLNDDECDCQTFQPTSLIPNPSFEEMNCCPTEISMLECASDWIQASDPTTDYVHTCGVLGNTSINAIAPLPFPDGEGAIGFRDGSQGAANFKEYTGTCLLSPLLEGSTYRLEMYIGFRDEEGSLDLDMAVYAAEQCTSLPFGVGDNIFGCPSNDPSYDILAELSVSGLNEWKKISLEFTPDKNYNVFVIGPACAANPNIALDPYFYFDNLILADSADFGLEISVEGQPCSEDLILTASGSVQGDIQWYKDGVAIVGETSGSYAIPFDEDRLGTYTYVIKNGEGCFSGDEYKLTESDLTGSEQVLETTLCPGESVIVNGETYTATGTYEQVVENPAGCDNKVIVIVGPEPACEDCNPGEQNRIDLLIKKISDDQYLISLMEEELIFSEPTLADLLQKLAKIDIKDKQSLDHYILELYQASDGISNKFDHSLSHRYQFIKDVNVGSRIRLELR